MQADTTIGTKMRGFRQVIDGVIYETENAELVATVITTDDGVDTDEVVQSLYRCEDNRWFVLTRKEECISGEMAALSVAEAAEWCRTHDLAPELLARYFDVGQRFAPPLQTCLLYTSPSPRD